MDDNDVATSIANRISKTNSTNRELYEWDYRNRLTSVTQQEFNAETQEWTTTQTIEHTYDYNNVWIRKTDGTNTTTDGILWSLTDHLGTVRDIIGTTDAHLTYDAFGNLTSGTNPILFGYTGKAFDVDTQLQNNINRWYDSTVGRWLSIDPIGWKCTPVQDDSLRVEWSRAVPVGVLPVISH